MSEPIRYNVNCGDDGYQIAESLGGEWVRYGDYAKLRMERIHDLNQIGGLQEENARLKAEVERLKAEKDQAECDHDNCQRRKVSIDNHRIDLFEENKKLKDDVERLRKAGDALAENFKVQTWPWTSRFNCYLAWNAAKEGKQP